MDWLTKVIDNEVKKKIILQDSELSEYGFFAIDEAEKLMTDRGFRRVKEGPRKVKDDNAWWTCYSYSCVSTFKEI